MKNMMLEKIVGVLVACAALVVSSVASADEAPPNPEGKVYVLKTVRVVGTRQMPSVVIEVARLSAAHEAGAAHEGLRRTLLEQSMPAAFKPQPQPQPAAP